MNPRAEPRRVPHSTARLPIAIAILLTILLAFVGCLGTSSKHPAAVEVRDVTGFSISESARIGVGVRSDFDRAHRLLADGDDRAAIEQLEALAADAPDFAAVHINLAIAYQRVDELDEAEQAVLRALELNPRHPVAQNELAIVYRRTGRFDEARVTYEKLLARYPDFHFARKNLAVLCDLYLADLTCALEHYRRYQALDPNDEKVAIWIADLENRVGKVER